jgi:hypothetical protein
VLVLLVVLACTPKSEWKERVETEFVVTGRRAATIQERTIAGTVMTVYEYADGVVESMQVQTFALPPGRDPMSAIVTMRDHYAKDTVVTHEEGVPLGDGLGVDLRFTKQYPDTGRLATRARILVQNRKLFSVVAYWPADKPELAKNGDRFVESFRFTGPGQNPLAVLADAGVAINQGSADDTGWYTFHSAKHKLTVSGPGPLTEGEVTLPNGEGRVYMVVSLALPARIKFTAACVTAGTRVIGREAFLAKLEGVTERRDRTIQGREAIEIDGPRESALAVFEPGRFCILSVEPYSKTMAVPKPDARRFFDSFVFD